MPAALLAVSVSAEADWRERFQSVTPTNFDDGGAVSHQFHLNAESYLTTTTVTAPAQARKLPSRPSEAMAEFTVSHRRGESEFADYVADEPWISAVIVLHAGAIAFEAYPRMRSDQRHFAWSVSKAVTGAVIAALVDDGVVALENTVGQYVPELSESDWADITVRDVAHMASGIDCLDSDGYQDPTTCIYRMEETLGLTADRGYQASFLQHLAGMKTHDSAGEVFEYATANTNVLGLIAESATGKPFATVVSEQIWRPVGAESDALLVINEEGYGYFGGGLSMRLRDVVRFGQLFVEPARFGIVSPSLVEAMQNEHGVPFNDEWQSELLEAFGDDAPRRAAWQWDLIWDDGGMFKAGYLGQGLYVDPDRELVIAWFGTGEDYGDRTSDMPLVSRQIARSSVLSRR